jgi:hypothetical protein
MRSISPVRLARRSVVLIMLVISDHWLRHLSYLSLFKSIDLNLNSLTRYRVISMDSPEKEKTAEEKEALKGLFDLAIPLGMPVSVIRELVENFELDLVRRKANVDMTGEVMDREILVLRGDLETVNAAKDYMFQALDRKVHEWNDENSERHKRMKKFYEQRLREAAETGDNKVTVPYDPSQMTEPPKNP